MRDRRKSVKTLTRRDWLSIAFIFCSSWLFFVLYRRPYVWEWDGFGFVSSTVLHIRHPLVTGRIGTLLYLIPFWEFDHRVLGLPIKDAWIATSQACMVASAISVVFTFLLAREMLGRLFGWIAALLLITGYGWVSYASETTAEMVMIASGMAGVYFYLRGLNVDSFRLMILGAALVGYAVLSKEQGLAFLPFLIVASLLHWQDRRVRQAQEALRRSGRTCYPTGASASSQSLLRLTHPTGSTEGLLLKWRILLILVVFLFVALSGPFYFWLKEGALYFQGFHNPGTEAKTGWNAFLERWKFLWTAWILLHGLLPLVLSGVGVITMIRARLWPPFFLTLSLIFPAALHLFVGFLGIRYYLFVVPPLAILAAYAIVYLCGSLSQNRAVVSICALAATSAIIFLTFTRQTLPEVIRVNQQLAERSGFAKTLLGDLPSEGCFIFGHNDVMIEFYRRIGERPGWSPLNFEWEAPKDRAGDIRKALDKGERVFIHPSALTGNEKDLRDMEAIRRTFSLRPLLGDMIYEIAPQAKTLHLGHRRSGMD